jgi:hypothetical protein
MSKRDSFEIKNTQKKLLLIMKTLKKSFSKDQISFALDEAMFETLIQIGKQWNVGGNLVGYTLKKKKSYKLWTNKAITEETKIKIEGRPGVSTGKMEELLKNPNSSAFKGSMVRGNTMKIRVKVDQVINRKKTRNYAGYFDREKGLIPSKRAVQNIVRLELEDFLKENLKKKAKFKGN